MNKIILFLATMLVMGVSAFAEKNTNDHEIVNQQARKAFNKEFSSASNISWEQRTDYTKATFSFNGQVLFAYYNSNGDLQAVVRNIVSDELPISLLAELRNGYSDYWISDLFEVASDGLTNYYVTVENSDKKIVLRSQGTGSWYTFNKIKKDAE